MFIKRKKKIKKPNNHLQFGDLIYIDDRSTLNLTAHIVRVVESGGKMHLRRFMPNHIMMVIGENPDIDKVEVIQANWAGVNIRPLKLWINHRKVNTVVKRYKKNFRQKSREKMHTWALQQLGRAYDIPAALGILGRYLILRYTKSKLAKWFMKKKRNPLSSKKRFICSEFVYLIYKQARIRLWKQCHYTNVTPYDEFRNKNFYRIHKRMNREYT